MQSATSLLIRNLVSQTKLERPWELRLSVHVKGMPPNTALGSRLTITWTGLSRQKMKGTGHSSPTRNPRGRLKSSLSTGQR